MANVTITTAAVFLPNIWSTETLRATENALVAAGLVKRYDAFVRSRGQTIEVPNISNLSVTAKSANTDVTTQSVTETKITITINKWYESSFAIEDMVSVQSNYDLRSEYSEKAKQNWSFKTDSNQWGKPEMDTLNKQDNLSVQLQRLNELGYGNSKRQSELLSNRKWES